MPENTHTPGPWFTFEHADHSGMEVGPRWNLSIESLKDCVKDVCTIRAFKYTYPCEMRAEQKANAILIAAAPDMLAALNKVYEEAKSWHDFHHGDSIVQCDAICACLPDMHAAISKAEGKQL